MACYGPVASSAQCLAVPGEAQQKESPHLLPAVLPLTMACLSLVLLMGTFLAGEPSLALPWGWGEGRQELALAL